VFISGWRSRFDRGLTGGAASDNKDSAGDNRGVDDVDRESLEVRAKSAVLEALAERGARGADGRPRDAAGCRAM